jgi:hypothetical protein
MKSTGTRTRSPPRLSGTGMMELGNQALGATAMPTDVIETLASGRWVMAGIVRSPFGIAGFAASGA